MTRDPHDTDAATERSRAELQAEIAALREEVAILRSAGAAGLPAAATHAARDDLSRAVLLSVLEDQQRSNQAVREIERRMSDILGNIDELVWSADATSQRVLFMNRAAEQIFGRSAREFMEDPGLRLAVVLPEDRPLALGFDRTVRTQGKAVAEFRVRRPEGEVRWVRTSGTFVPAAGGKPARVDGVLSDITDMKRALAARAESEQQFRGIVEQSMAGVYIIQDGKIAYANQHLADIAGYTSPAELIGVDALSFVIESERAGIAERMRQRLSGEVTHMRYETVAIRKDGTTFDMGVDGASATFRGRPAIIGLMQDISDRKRAEQQIQRYIAQLQTAFMRTVEVAMNLSEMRDPYTAGHERRVAEIAVAIGRELGLDDDRLHGLRVAGYLHDIGKISIPAEILSKPGKLTPIEYNLIKGHPQAGFDVLKNVDFPWPVAQVALQHHERIDGSGYPQGLRGEDILLEARIMAVADVVEAMSAHRPYRAGLGIDAALAEIARGRGSHFDPAVADACLRLFRDKHYAIPE